MISEFSIKNRNAFLNTPNFVISYVFLTIKVLPDWQFCCLYASENRLLISSLFTEKLT